MKISVEFERWELEFLLDSLDVAADTDKDVATLYDKLLAATKELRKAKGE